MIGIGIPYLTKVSENHKSKLIQDPIPFISTGKSQKVEQDQKTTFFGEFTVALPVIWVPTGPRDIECGLVFDHKSLSTGNRHIRYFLGVVKGPVGSYGVP